MEQNAFLFSSFSLTFSVTRFHHPESRKALIRLEQGARSYMNRAIMSHGALAVIYGLHLKYFIKDPEVSNLFLAKSVIGCSDR